MSLLVALPPPLCKEVLSFLVVTMSKRIPSGRDRDSDYPTIISRTLDHRAILSALLSLSRGIRTLLVETPELFLSHTGPRWYFYNQPRTSKSEAHQPALFIGSSPQLTDRRLWGLLHLLQPVVSTLCDLDLRGCPQLTAASVVVVFQSCPSLVRLDLGECPGLDLVELSKRLVLTPHESLVATRLGLMEVCGSGQGVCWVGYRQQWAFSQEGCNDKHVGRGYRIWTIGGKQNTYESSSRGGPSKEAQELDTFHKVGSSPRLLPAVRSIEAIMLAQQLKAGQPAIFTLGINICEQCKTSFAEFMPQDGKGHEAIATDEARLRHLREYGRHVCQECGRSAFLCMNCASYEYHYCTDEDCKVGRKSCDVASKVCAANIPHTKRSCRNGPVTNTQVCYCVECDGGVSITCLFETKDEAGIASLRQDGTKHFEMTRCRWAEGDGTCRWPSDWKMFCRDDDGSCAPERDLCQRCEAWQCPRCVFYHATYCEGCDRAGCPECRPLHSCSSCESSAVPLCPRCDPLPICEECGPFKGFDGQDYPTRHCSECLREKHPPAMPAGEEPM
jgi:hypothetical protein